MRYRSASRTTMTGSERGDKRTLATYSGTPCPAHMNCAIGPTQAASEPVETAAEADRMPPPWHLPHGNLRIKSPLAATKQSKSSGEDDHGSVRAGVNSGHQGAATTSATGPRCAKRGWQGEEWRLLTSRRWRLPNEPL